MEYKSQLSSIQKTTVIKNINESSKNYIIHNFILENKFNFILYIVESNFELELATKEIEFYSQDIEILKFPEWDIVPYDINSPDIKIQTERIKTLNKLLSIDKEKKHILILSKNSIVQKVPNKDDLNTINFFINQKITKESIKYTIESNCYQLKNTASNLGDYCINNNTIDIATFDEQYYKIKIIDNIITEIKSFNPKTQIAFNSHDDILLLPIREILFYKNNIQNFKQNYRKLFSNSMENDDLYTNISSNILYNGSENWLPLFYNNELTSILNYIPQNSVIFYSKKIEDKTANFRKTVEKFYNLRAEERKINKNSTYNPIPIELMYLEMNKIKSKLDEYINLIFDTENTIRNKNHITLNFKTVPNFQSDEKEVFKTLQKYLDKALNKAEYKTYN